jgi:2'-deoxycytidine 5'-triphosphate deaminase (DCD)
MLDAFGLCHRSHEVPFILDHGQIVGRLVYEKMLDRPDALYGQRINSNYQAQGPETEQAFSGVMRQSPDLIQLNRSYSRRTSRPRRCRFMLR